MDALIEQFQEKLAEHTPYIEEMRRRIYRIALFIAAVFVIGFFATIPIFKALNHFFQVKDAAIVVTSPFQFLDLAMSTGMFFSVVLSLPFVVYQVLAFVNSGLTQNEKKAAYFYSSLVFALFAIGFAYGFATMFYSVNLMAGVNISMGLQNYWDISKYLTQIFLTSALLGLLFQFPIVLTILSRIGAINTKFLKAKRRYAMAAIFIIVSLLPPTDGLSLIVMSLPLVLMYELTVWISSNKEPSESFILATNN